MLNTRTLTTAAALLSTCGLAQAEDFFFSANINADQEVPANDSLMVGFLAGIYDSNDQSFTFNWLLTENPIGDPAAPGAHIHMAPAGENGPIVFGFADGVWEFSGSEQWVDMSDDHVDALFDGNLYVNFHTSAFPGGEVRGQILQVPAPGTMALAGAGLMFFGRRRRS